MGPGAKCPIQLPPPFVGNFYAFPWLLARFLDPGGVWTWGDRAPIFLAATRLLRVQVSTAVPLPGLGIEEPIWK